MEGEFYVGQARYAKGMMIIRPKAGTGMGGGRVARLCQALKARWTNRENGYIMSPAKAEKLAKLVVTGKDASLKFDSVYSAHYELD
jgi:hypothetical protein